MTQTTGVFDRIADDAVAELALRRRGDGGVDAAVAAAGLIAHRAAKEVVDRDRVIRIARREGATLRALAEATGISRQTVANICDTGERRPRRTR